ncbi:MAG: hypothetical protein V4475_22650, partial [Pseudomonadota bacterium]
MSGLFRRQPSTGAKLFVRAEAQRFSGSFGALGNARKGAKAPSREQRTFDPAGQSSADTVPRIQSLRLC